MKRDINALYKRANTLDGQPAFLMSTCERVAELVEAFLNEGAKDLLDPAIKATISLGRIAVLTGHAVCDQGSWEPYKNEPKLAKLMSLVSTIGKYSRGAATKEDLWEAVRHCGLYNPKDHGTGLYLRRQQDALAVEVDEQIKMLEERAGWAVYHVDEEKEAERIRSAGDNDKAQLQALGNVSNGVDERRDVREQLTEIFNDLDEQDPVVMAGFSVLTHLESRGHDVGQIQAATDASVLLSELLEVK